MTMEDLTPYREPFKAVVLKHIQESLGAPAWDRLRSMADNRRRHADPHAAVDLTATPEMLLDAGMSEDSISVTETLTYEVFWKNAAQIGQIEGQPVYYVDGQGIYLWGRKPDSRPVLMFWVTHPAYPPSW